MVLIMQINVLNQRPITKKQPSFKAIIHYVNRPRFYEILQQLPDCFEVGNKYNKDWTIEEGAVKKASAFTLKTCNCLVGSIINPETKLGNFFHISPYEKNINRIDEIKDIIFEQARMLKDNSKQKLEGLILGGECKRISDKGDRKLKETFITAFEKIKKELEMDYSIISGRTNATYWLDIISDATKNAHYVNVQQKRPFEIKNLEELEQVFETKILSPKDSIKLYDGEIVKEIREFKKD